MEPSGQSISEHVNQEWSQQIQDMGFSKAVAEKSLFLTQNASVEAAIEWINEHSSDPDFEEELQIVGTSESKPKLSKEEAAKKARELQEKLRKQREQKDKELEIEQEKERIRGQRELNEAKRKMEEQERKRAIEEQMREKKKQQEELRKMQEMLKRDKQERFGKIQTEEANEKSASERIQHSVKTIKTLYPEFRNPGVAKTCLNTLKIYLSNIQQNPSEDKFKNIRKQNKAFQERVAKVTGGVKFLTAVGFVEEEEFFSFKQVNNSLLEEGLKVLEEALQTFK